MIVLFHMLLPLAAVVVIFAPVIRVNDGAVTFSATARPAHALTALLLIALALPAAASEASHPRRRGTSSQPRPLIIGLVCEGGAAPRRELHHWDPRVPITDSPEQCLDGNTKLRITPRSVALEYNPETESLNVVLTISEADTRAIDKLFTVALMSGVRRDLILVDGKVVVSRNVTSVFSGPTLQIGMRSDEDATAVAAVLSGP